MPAPSSNANARSLSKIKAKHEALHKKQEEEDRALEAKIVAKQKQIKEESSRREEGGQGEKEEGRIW